MRKEGERLIIEPVQDLTLAEVLAGLEPLNEDFPQIGDLPLKPVEL